MTARTPNEPRKKTFILKFMNPPKYYCVPFLLLLTLLLACNGPKTAEQNVENDPVGEYPGGQETYHPFDGYIDGVYQTFSGARGGQHWPTKTIGKEKWTYKRLGVHTEVAFVAFQTGQCLHKRKFGLENDTLVYAEEEDIFLPVDTGNVCRYSFVIFKDTAVAFTAECTGDLQEKSEAVKTAELFKMWQSHQANFNQFKASLGFDGVKDVAAMEIYEDFWLGYESNIGQYLNAETPLKITISYNDQAMEDKVILCTTEEEKRNFFTNAEKTRGKSTLVSTQGNQAVFAWKSPHKRVYLKELVFSDKRILLEIKLFDILEE
jgi:hypothetical protein